MNDAGDGAAPLVVAADLLYEITLARALARCCSRCRRAGARVLVTDSQGFARREFLEELHAAEGAAPGTFAFEVVGLDARVFADLSGEVAVRRLVLEPP